MTLQKISNYPEIEVEGNYPLEPYTNHAGRGAGIGAERLPNMSNVPKKTVS